MENVNSQKCIINCSATPKNRYHEGLLLKEHLHMGDIEWKPSKVKLLKFDDPFNMRLAIPKLREEYTIFNSNVMEYLWNNTEQIPEKFHSTKKILKYIYFGNTKFLNSYQEMVIPYFFCINPDISHASHRVGYDRKILFELKGGMIEHYLAYYEK